jgi:hypothetical protein
MADLVRLEEHQTFSSASKRARFLAMEHEQKTGVRRTPTGWEVLVSASMRTNAAHHQEIYPQECEQIASDCEDELGDEMQLLAEELRSDSEDWARSAEEGWYHSDDDQPKDPDDHDSVYGRFQAPRDASGRTLSSGSGW